MKEEKVYFMENSREVQQQANEQDRQNIAGRVQQEAGGNQRGINNDNQQKEEKKGMSFVWVALGSLVPFAIPLYIWAFSYIIRGKKPFYDKEPGLAKGLAILCTSPVYVLAVIMFGIKDFIKNRKRTDINDIQMDPVEENGPDVEPSLEQNNELPKNIEQVKPKVEQKVEQSVEKDDVPIIHNETEELNHNQKEQSTETVKESPEDIPIPQEPVLNNVSTEMSAASKLKKA